jgi:hypothetical protein
MYTPVRQIKEAAVGFETKQSKFTHQGVDMKANHIFIGSMLLCATGAWAVQQPAKQLDSRSAHAILESKCTKCHSVKVIDAALGAHKDMTKIQKEMEDKGASLSASEREVLGIFWKKRNPLKSNK